jgi:hypothetical protein
MQVDGRLLVYRSGNLTADAQEAVWGRVFNMRRKAFNYRRPLNGPNAKYKFRYVMDA